jgi:flagellar biosynthesis GTPase FlhF
MLNVDIDGTSSAIVVYAILNLYFDVVLDMHELGQAWTVSSIMHLVLVDGT